MKEEQYMNDTAWLWSLPNITFHKIVSCKWRCSTFGRLGTRKSWSLYNWKAVVRSEKMSALTKTKQSSRTLGVEPRWKFPRIKSRYCSSQYLMELRHIFETKPATLTANPICWRFILSVKIKLIFGPKIPFSLKKSWKVKFSLIVHFQHHNT